MNPQTGEIVSVSATNTRPVSAPWVPWSVGDVFEVKGCLFRVEYINVGKQRISITPVPQES